MPPDSRIDLEFTLRRRFKKANFRPLQREVIECALAGHDVFVQTATGFGKSLCFQLPAVIDHGSRAIPTHNYQNILCRWILTESFYQLQLLYHLCFR
ncbi:Nucleolar DNA helicase of the RecQ family [Golovinomyces cichoracearum]|uniref:Nucleolar DNA helicase of the RecQ family n=1 Tax=Golovinomyces cichoracearum TaxID=62708 RepID=A0A420IQ38_9PEZI|nr:Nucleolar DNA helicase of the RecQ family [Golovinomyces cichoracearum]